MHIPRLTCVLLDMPLAPAFPLHARHHMSCAAALLLPSCLPHLPMCPQLHAGDHPGCAQQACGVHPPLRHAGHRRRHWCAAREPWELGSRWLIRGAAVDMEVGLHRQDGLAHDGGMVPHCSPHLPRSSFVLAGLFLSFIGLQASEVGWLSSLCSHARPWAAHASSRRSPPMLSHMPAVLMNALMSCHPVSRAAVPDRPCQATCHVVTNALMPCLQGLGVTTYNSATLVTLGEALSCGRSSRLGTWAAALGASNHVALRTRLTPRRMPCPPPACHPLLSAMPSSQAAAPPATARSSTPFPALTFLAARCAASAQTAPPRPTWGSFSPLVSSAAGTAVQLAVQWGLRLQQACLRSAWYCTRRLHAATPHHVLTWVPMAVCCADSYSCGSAGVMRSATMWLGIAGGMLMTVLMSKVGGRAAGGLVRCGQPSGPFWGRTALKMYKPPP